MSTTNQPQQTFTRLQVSDTATNAAIQDIYNKLAQLQLLISQIMAKQ